MGGGKGGGKIRVAEYCMTIHVGVCAAGRGLELLNIKVGEKIAWRGRRSRNDVWRIDKRDLFGGNKKEGGVRGLAWWLNGNENQTLPAALSKRMGLAPDQCPGFRGLASIFFTGLRTDDASGLSFFWPGFFGAVDVPPPLNTGGGLDGLIFSILRGEPRGFMWCANNPYMKTISARVRRAPEGLNPSIALIRVQDSSEGDAQYAANPAHIIFECMTNTDWGMGESFGAFDIGSYERCAQTLYDEKFGLNMIWMRQSKIEDFVKEVLDHIQGAMFVNPSTGKHTLKLLRDDYDADNLPLLNPDNATLTTFKMKAWGDISNEVVVTWTNPETGKEETVSAHDLAAMSMQGAPVSASRNYYGIASQELALRVAERDLAAVVHPIATCDAEVSREFWKTVVYDVVELSWPEHGVQSSIFRVAQVTNGSTSRTVKLSLYEDVFSLARANYLAPNDTGWQNPSTDPAPLIHYHLGTAPAFMTSAALGLDDIGDLPYPEALAAITVGPDDPDDIGYELISYTSNVLGEPEQESLGERQLNGTWASDIALPLETSTLIPSLGGYLGNSPLAGDFIMIGNVPDELSEIAVVRSVTAQGYLINRGLLDTTPKAWPVGTRIWSVPANFPAPDVTRRSAFEDVSYRLLTQTSRGRLAIDDAPELDVTLTERPHLPNRPANVKVGGTAFGTHDMAGATTVPVTWANRNRLDESTQVMLWTDPSVDGEAGQTTRIYLMRQNGTVITILDDLTGDSYALNRSAFAGEPLVRLQVMAVRDGLESLQGHEILIDASAPPVNDYLKINATDYLLLNNDGSRLIL